MTPRPFLISLAVLLALALAGCGGGGDDDTTASAPVTTEEASSLTKEELIAQGDGICAEVNAAVGSAQSGESDEQISQVADLYSGMVERLKGLGAPDDSGGYSEFIDAAEGLDQAQSDLALAAARGDESLAEAESSAASALDAFQEAASDYGFEDCAAAPSAPVAPAGGGAPGEEEMEVAPEEEAAPEEVAPEVEEAAPEEVAPETGGAGGTAGGGTGTGGEAGSGGGSAGGIGPG